MATPVVPSQFAVGKNRIIHKPTTATFSFETGHTTFKSINWGRADEQLSSGLHYRKDVGPAGNENRAVHQPQDRQGARDHRPSARVGPRRRGVRMMKRREFITLL